jgi:hypothetical protein
MVQPSINKYFNPLKDSDNKMDETDNYDELDNSDELIEY